TDVENGFIASEAQVVYQPVTHVKFPRVTAGEHQRRANQTTHADISGDLFEGENPDDAGTISVTQQEKYGNHCGKTSDQQAAHNAGRVKAVIGFFVGHESGAPPEQSRIKLVASSERKCRG